MAVRKNAHAKCLNKTGYELVNVPDLKRINAKQNKH